MQFFANKKRFLYLSIFLYALILLFSGLLLISINQDSEESSNATQGRLVLQFYRVETTSVSDSMSSYTSPVFYSMSSDKPAIVTIRPDDSYEEDEGDYVDSSDATVITSFPFSDTIINTWTTSFNYTVSIIDPAWQFLGVWRGYNWFNESDDAWASTWDSPNRSIYGTMKTRDTYFSSGDGFDYFTFLFYKN